MNLEQLIHDASARANLNLVHLGRVPITFVGYRPDHNPGFMFDNETMMDFGLPPDIMEDLSDPGDLKNILAMLARQFISMFGCIQIVQYAEAWRATLPADIDPTTIDTIADHPNREEVIIYSAEDLDDNRLTGFQELLRPAGFPPYLGPLEISDGKSQTGRFTGFYGNEKLVLRLRKGLRNRKDRNAFSQE